MKFCFEIKLEAVKSYLSGCSEKQVTKQYGINRTDLFICYCTKCRLQPISSLYRDIECRSGNLETKSCCAVVDDAVTMSDEDHRMVWKAGSETLHQKILRFRIKGAAEFIQQENAAWA